MGASRAAPSSRPGAPSGTAGRLDELRRPAAWPVSRRGDGRPLGDEARAGLVETHISWVLLGADRVFKLKKPLDLGFLDYSTVERRRHFCELEVQLNRRLAPDTYLGVRPVVLDAAGCAVFGRADADADGAVLDWAVEMARLPAERMLERLLERGEVDNRLMEELAGLLARFHGAAATGPGVDEHAAPAALARRLKRDLDDLRDFTGDGPEASLSPTLADFLARALAAELGDRSELLARRVGAGRAREGHGDLHAGNICCTGDRPVIYDCIEFDPALRCGDVAADLAFLAMDLDRRGYRGFSRYLVRRYAALTDDPSLPRLMPLFKAWRALVRGKVDSIRAADDQLADPVRAAARAEARHAFQVAAVALAPPVLVLMCGLPASGKSWLARRLARPLGALVLRSDVLRKQLAGVPPDSPGRAAWGQGLYAHDAVEHTYQVLLDEAIDVLDHGRSVIVDATFADERRRRRFVETTARLDHPVVLVHLDCPESLALERLRERAARPGGASDADEAVYRRAVEAFDPPDELHPSLRVDAAHDALPEVVAGAVLDRGLTQIHDTAPGRDLVPGRTPPSPEES